MIAREQFARWEADPVGFARTILKFEPYSQQRRILEALRDHDRVAVRAGNSVGKTAVAACAVLGHLARGPGSVAITTAPTERQVRKVLWREVAARHRAAGGFFGGATLTDLELFVEPGWFATGLSTDSTEAFQGWHAARMLVVVDEASGVDEQTWEAIEGLLASGDAKLLAISNPLRTSGTFYEAFARNRGEWYVITISAFDTPNLTGEAVSRQAAKRLVSRRWVERMAGRGERSNEYRIRVLGEFPTESDDGVVALGDLEVAHANSFEAGLPLVLGVDVARFGSDRTVVAAREGSRIRVADSYQGRDLMHTSGRVTELARILHAAHQRKPTIVVDDIGVGGGLTDRLTELGEFGVVAFNASGKSRRYFNRRSELWFDFAEMLPTLDLDPADTELGADFLAPVYSLQSDASKRIEAKADTRRRLRRSPDRADAVLLTLVVDPPRRPGAPAPRVATIHVPRGRIPGVVGRGRDPLVEALRGVGLTFPEQAGSLESHLGSQARPDPGPAPRLALGPPGRGLDGRWSRRL